MRLLIIKHRKSPRQGLTGPETKYDIGIPVQSQALPGLRTRKKNKLSSFRFIVSVADKKCKRFA